MLKINTKETVTFAVLMALTVIITMLIRIPAVVTNGYVNLGDMVVFFSAMILGKKAGFYVGGFGSAIADLLLGYAYYAPITFIVKGLEGWLCGWIYERSHKQKPLLSAMLAGIWMVCGYFVAESFLYTPAAALAATPGNLAQGVMGAVSALLLEKSVGTQLHT